MGTAKQSRTTFIRCLVLLSALIVGCASKDAKELENRNAPADIKAIRVSELVLGVGDTVEVSVYRHDDLKKTVKIDLSGMIMFPLIGDIKAADKGIVELRNELKERLSKYVVDPQVTISLTSVQSQKVMVLGEVNNPGIFSVDTDLSVMEAISKAGGMTDDAKMSNVLMISRKAGKAEISSLDLKKVLKGGDLSQNVPIRAGDIIYVPAVAIADVSWYFGHLSKILSPIVNLESGIVLWPQVRDVIQGKSGLNNTIAVPIN